MPEVLAIIRRPRFGCDDRGGVSLSFETYVDESTAASQWLSVDAAVEAIKASGVSDVAKLDGRACYVERGTGTLTFKRMARI